MKSKRAFSLAEILITLSIIGMIATLTIPVLVSDANDAELYVKWRKTFADISNATRMANILNGGIDFTSTTTMRDDYCNYLQYTKKDTINNIFAPKYIYYKNTQGEGWDFSTSSTPSAILSNGTLLRFESKGTGCPHQSNKLTGICGHFFIDVNGKKGPNMWGKDLFHIWIVKRSGQYIAFPFGSNEDGMICTKGSNNQSTSYGCSALALRTDNMP